MAFWKLQLVLGSDDRPELRLMKATLKLPVKKQISSQCFTCRLRGDFGQDASADGFSGLPRACEKRLEDPFPPSWLVSRGPACSLGLSPAACGPVPALPEPPPLSQGLAREATCSSPPWTGTLWPVPLILGGLFPVEDASCPTTAPSLLTLCPSSNEPLNL